jgi:hypothetical protein
MAGYRQIHTKIWKDEYFIELSPEEKLIFIYLFSNELTSISGIYKIPSRVISNETGLDHQFVLDTLEKFENDEKIFREDGIIWVIKMQEYHANASPTTMKKVTDDVSKLPDNTLKMKYLEFYRGIDTPSIPYPYPNREAKEEEEAKAKSKDKAEGAAVSPIQGAIESITGIMPSNPDDIMALDEITAMNPLQEDIQSAHDWIMSKGRRVYHYRSLVNPIKVSIAKRVQQPKKVMDRETAEAKRLKMEQDAEETAKILRQGMEEQNANRLSV